MTDSRLRNYLFSDALARSRVRGGVYGPFHRRRSPSQTLASDLSQMSSGMLWGLTPRGGKCPTVQCYVGRLPPSESGIEFLTNAMPFQTDLPDGQVAAWYLEDSPFTGTIEVGGQIFAAITIIVVEQRA